VVPVIEVKTGFRISIAMSHDDLEAFLAAEILELTDSCGGIKH
jgi:hypothetical protein